MVRERGIVTVKNATYLGKISDLIMHYLEAIVIWELKTMSIHY